MMLKGLTAGTASRTVSSTRPVSSRRPVAFRGVRPSVRVFAEAEGEQKQQRAPRKEKVITVQLEDVKEGDEFEGTVASVEDYGAFVEFGARVAGMIHISKLGAGFVKNVKDVVQVGQSVGVTVLQVDAAKGRVSLGLKGAAGAAVAESSGREESSEDNRRDDFNDEDMWGVDLEEGQVEVTPEVRGFEDMSVILEESNADELTEAAIAEMEGDDETEIEFELDAPPYLAEVAGTITRVDANGVTLEFPWQAAMLTGSISKEELKVPFAALPAARQAALTNEWAETGYLPPAYVAMDDDEFDAAAYYKVGEKLAAFVLDSDMDGAGLALTHFTDEEIAGDAVDAFEGIEDDEELLDMLADGAEADEALAVTPEDLMEEEADVAKAAAASLSEHAAEDAAAYGFATRASLLRNKDGQMVSPMGLPSRPTNAIDPAALTAQPTKEVDFDGDEVELEDYWTVDYSVPKKAMAKVGLKMTFNEAGEAVFEEREDFNGNFPSFSLAGDVSARAAALADDLLTADDEEEAVPVRAMRRPIVLAAAVTSISAATVKELREKTGAGMMDCKKALAENEGDMDKASEWLRKKGLAGADKKAGRLAAEGAIARYIHPGGRLGVLLEVNCETDFVAASEKFNALVNELGMIIASTDCVCVLPEEVPAELLAKEREVEMGKEDLAAKPEAMRAKIVEGRLDKIKNGMALMNQAALSDPNKTVADLVKETIAAVGENIKVRRFLKYRLGEGLEKRSNDFAAEVAQQTQAKAAAPKKEEPKKEEPKKEEPKKATVAVSASVVKELRDATGAGMMDCKKALAENEGDMEKAQEWLRQKGLAGADKKAGRLAAEGVVAAYIHPGSRLGVLLEVNCETDFVAASEKFNELVNYIAMGIAAAQGVAYVSAEEIPAEVFEREKQLEMAREDLKSKPEAIRAKIAEGRARKIADDMAVLNQPFLVDQSKTVGEAIKEAIAAIGEKISVRRFTKFNLGEGLEKKSNDFAAEVAAATGQK